MSKHTATRQLVLAMAALGGSLLTGTAALAQEADALGEITVQSTRYVVRAEGPTAKEAGRTDSGIPISEVEIIHHVRFDDLDLTSETGAQALRQRIRTVAVQGCRRLEGTNPQLSSDQECVGAAVKDARPQIESAIAAARRPG
jgi:UrcA family protein